MIKKVLISLALLIFTLPLQADFNFLSLNAVTATGAGEWMGVDEGTAVGVTWRLVVTGAPSGQSTTLEGCIEPTTGGCNTNTTYTLDTSTTTTNEMRHVVNKDVRYLRCNLGTLTGRTSPTVSCRIYKGHKP